MNIDSFTKPTLIEPGVKYFLSETLKQCRIFKNTYNNMLINISLGIGFLVILGIILFFKYKGKLTPVEKDMKNRQKQQYILSKIQNFQESKQRASQQLITGLPHWDTEYDVIHRKINGKQVYQ
jgi:hypothetical protein